MADLTRRQIAMMADEVGITDHSAAVELVRRAFEVSRSARAALAEPAPEDDVALLREALAATAAQRRAEDDARAVLARWGRQPDWSADDIPPGPFSESELREQWNQQADEYNLWDSLDSCEQLAWAQACAIQRDRNAKPTPSAEGEAAELVALIRQISLAWEPDACLLGNMTARQLTRAADLLAQRPEPAPVSEPVAWLWEYIGSDPYPDRFSPVARSLREMDPANPPFPDSWRPVAPLYALPLPAEEVE